MSTNMFNFCLTKSRTFQARLSVRMKVLRRARCKKQMGNMNPQCGVIISCLLRGSIRPIDIWPSGWVMPQKKWGRNVTGTFEMYVILDKLMGRQSKIPLPRFLTEIVLNIRALHLVMFELFTFCSV